MESRACPVTFCPYSNMRQREKMVIKATLQRITCLEVEKLLEIPPIYTQRGENKAFFLSLRVEIGPFPKHLSL